MSPEERNRKAAAAFNEAAARNGGIDLAPVAKWIIENKVAVTQTRSQDIIGLGVDGKEIKPYKVASVDLSVVPNWRTVAEGAEALSRTLIADRRNIVAAVGKKFEHSRPLCFVDLDGPEAQTLFLGFNAPKTFTVGSGRDGGVQLWFFAPPNCDKPKIEFVEGGSTIQFSTRGYGLLPGSWHAEAEKFYRILRDRETVELPQDVYDAMLQTAKKVNHEAKQRIEAGEKIPKGAQDIWITRYAGAMRRDGLPESTCYAACADLARNHCEEPATEGWIEKTLREKVRRWYRDDGWDGADFLDLPEVPRPAAVKPAASPGLSDDKFADHFARCYPTYRWVRETDEWVAFTDGRWRSAHTKDVREAVVQLMRSAYDDYCADNDQGDEYTEELKKFSKQRRKAEFANTVASLAGPRRGVSLTAFNTSLDLLAVGAGRVVDLARFEIRDGRPEDMLSRGSDTILPDTLREPNCPLWREHIDKVTCGDKEYAKYIQRLFGYLLTGRNGEQKLWGVLGPGSNGKGVTFFTLMHLLGDLADVTAYNSFAQTKQARDGSAATPDKAAWFGTRLQIIDENEKMIVFSNAAIQQVTGSSPIKVRHNYGHPFTMPMTAKFVFLCNWEPKLDTTKYATQRRIVMLPFNATFEPENGTRILEYGDTLLAEEGPEILLWAIEGLRMYQEYGAGALEASSTAAVLAATKRYFQRSNILYELVEDGVLILEKGAVATWEALLAAIHGYWQRKDMPQLPEDEVSDALRAYGCRRERKRVDGRQQRLWTGITLPK